MRCVKLRGGGCSKHRFIPAPPSVISPLCETGGQWGALPSLFPVCRCREASGFLESTKGHTLGFHHQLWTCPCATVPCAGDRSEHKICPINKENQQGLKVQSSRGTSEPNKELSGLGHPVPPGLYSSSVGEFSAAPQG